MNQSSSLWWGPTRLPLPLPRRGTSRPAGALHQGSTGSPGGAKGGCGSSCFPALELQNGKAGAALHFDVG
jgi:hypothetical protein